jgi:CopG family nickel-responsive transcriptional regulator
MADADALVRFGVAMPAGLLAEFDALVAERGYANRSDALRELVRREIVKEEWEKGAGQVTGVLTIVYDHDAGVGDALVKVQHAQHEAIVCTMHVHLDEHRCMEMVVLRGPAQTVKSIASHLSSVRGVHYGQLTAAAVEPEHSHHHPSTAPAPGDTLREI